MATDDLDDFAKPLGTEMRRCTPEEQAATAFGWFLEHTRIKLLGEFQPVYVPVAVDDRYPDA